MRARGREWAASPAPRKAQGDWSPPISRSRCKQRYPHNKVCNLRLFSRVRVDGIKKWVQMLGALPAERLTDKLLRDELAARAQ